MLYGYLVTQSEQVLKKDLINLKTSTMKVNSVLPQCRTAQTLGRYDNCPLGIFEEVLVEGISNEIIRVILESRHLAPW